MGAVLLAGGCAGGGEAEEEVKEEAGEEAAEPSGAQEEAQPEQGTSISDYYRGFMTPEKGAWAEWEMVSNGESAEMRYVYAGKGTIEGKEAEGFEYTFKMEGQEMAAQTWFSARNPVKSVIKMQGRVICYSLPTPQVAPSAETPESYEAEEISQKPDVSFGSFTAKSGKTVDVVKFSEARDGKKAVVWVSSEVPFGMVKMVSDGKTFMELVDFGLSGGELTITEEEVENCQEFSIPEMPGSPGQ